VKGIARYGETTPLTPGEINALATTGSYTPSPAPTLDNAVTRRWESVGMNGAFIISNPRPDATSGPGSPVPVTPAPTPGTGDGDTSGCTSGGPGSTSCGAGSGGCTVSCGTGYYSCCNVNSNHCDCKQPTS
jgi:hypothetical protein